MYKIISALVICFSHGFAWRFEPCSEKYSQGVCDDIQSNGCQNLVDVTWPNELSMHDSINSIRGVHNCVRLFEDVNCRGRSQAFYSRGPGLDDLSKVNFANLASSIGSCMEYECAYRNWNHGEFDCINHDHFWAGEHKNLKSVEVNDEQNPIVKYQLGSNGRVEYLVAKIKVSLLDKGSTPDDRAREYVNKTGNPNDVPGMIIGDRLGGKGSDLFNIFPQNSYVAMSVYNEAMDRIVYSFTARNNEVWLEVNLIYKNDQATRPLALVYRINPAFFYMRNVVNP